MSVEHNILPNRQGDDDGDSDDIERTATISVVPERKRLATDDGESESTTVHNTNLSGLADISVSLDGTFVVEEMWTDHIAEIWWAPDDGDDVLLESQVLTDDSPFSVDADVPECDGGALEYHLHDGNGTYVDMDVSSGQIEIDW